MEVEEDMVRDEEVIGDEAGEMVPVMEYDTTCKGCKVSQNDRALEKPFRHTIIQT